MTRPRTDADAGHCNLPLAKRAVSLIDTLTRGGDPFVSRSTAAMQLSGKRSRDRRTDPVQALALAVDNGDIVCVPRPDTGEQCLTVKDKRRLAQCAARYRQHDERQNAQACIERVEQPGTPDVLDRWYVEGPL